MTASIRRPSHGEESDSSASLGADYEAAIDEIERYFDNEPKPGSTEADSFNLLAQVIENYERRRWPIDR